MEDPYVYPGTEVLINRFDLRNDDLLHAHERALSRARIRRPPPLVSMTPKGLSEIHKHIFQDIYPWAGEIRTCDLSKGTSFFCLPKHLPKQLEHRMQRLREDTDLPRPIPHVFAKQAAEHIAELNALHPFREGNGRTLRLFAAQLAERAGLELDIRKIDHDRWIEGSIRSFDDGDTTILRETLENALSRRARRIEKEQVRER
ncbi:MAG: Fic family protein [Alphaproteobacteria bacterium]